MQRRAFLTQTAVAGAALVCAGQAQATTYQPSAVILWNRALAQAVINSITPVTVAARAMAMVHEAIYNAWASYDWRAEFTLPWMQMRPSRERNHTNKTVALSHAAHGVLTELFPNQVQALFDPLLQQLTATGWQSHGGWHAANLGRNVAYRLIESRNNDGANQRGDLAEGAYADWTGYAPVNTPDLITDLARWQPLRLPNAAGVLTVQRFLTPHWGRVRPFALRSGSELRKHVSPLLATDHEIDEILKLSADLDDRSKALGDFFAANPGSVTPPGQWLQFAETVARNDCNDLDDDVKLFFATAQAGLDASIAAWDTKRANDQSRPASVIPNLFRGAMIKAWGGPGMGERKIRGEDWIPWQRPANRTPPFPDYVSGHSTFSAAMASTIAALRGSDKITLTATVPAGAFRTDPGLPLTDQTFVWKKLSDVADAAGFSRRVTGIHWSRSDFGGRTLGKQVGQAVVSKCQRLFHGWC